MGGNRFGRLAAMETALNTCIRCGYCVEHCPVFRHTLWESDSPRGKMVLLYGLLQGEIRAAGEALEKAFECFNCGQCEKSCSSGVPILKVYEAARADLFDMGHAALGTTSQTDEALCARCLQCARLCPHEARSLRHGSVVTDLSKCASCGNCVDACPARAVHLERGHGTSPEELAGAMRSFFAGQGKDGAKAVVFNCSWSGSPGLQTARLAAKGPDPEHITLVTACAGRLTAAVVLEAFHLGAWGVLVNRCPEEECQHKASARVGQRVQSLQRTLESIGIEPGRLKSAVVRRDDQKSVAAEVASFLQEIRSLGPILER